MSYTEFTCRSGGNNLYAGTLDGSAEASTTPLITYTNANWTSTTGVFIVASGNPVTAGVAVGQFASVYNDGASAPAVFVGRITAVTSTQITVSTTAKSGTAPTTSATARTLVVGGSWNGPAAASGFPLSFVTSTLTDSSSDPVRINLKNDQTYSITTGITAANASVKFEGYTSTFGDGGRATIDGGTSAIVLLTINGAGVALESLIFSNNGTTGSNSGVNFNVFGVCRRCVFHDLRGFGLAAGGQGGIILVECEAYTCNTSNTASFGGLKPTVAIRCIAHDNAGSNSSGFVGLGNASSAFVDCVSDTNGQFGFVAGSGGYLSVTNCDAYNNTSDGINTAANNGLGGYVENCNLVKNGGYGIKGVAGSQTLVVINCGYGSGTTTNTSGTTNGVSVQESGAVTYASGVTPWVDPANGDFRINLAAAKSTGRGTYMQTQASYAGTVGYPDIGAAQHLDSIRQSGPITATTWSYIDGG